MSNLTHTIEKTKQIPHNKIPEEKVNRIREFCLTGTRADAAKKYGVSFGFVLRITKELSKRRKEPLRVGSVHFRGENQKKLYELVSKGVLGSKVLEMGHKRQDLYDFIAKLKIGGIAVEKKLVGKPRKSNYKTPMTEFFYKIISQ